MLERSVSRRRHVLALMARYPRLGGGKTRLARTLGGGAAFELYCAFLRDLDERLSAGPWRLRWLYTPAHEPFASWLGTGRQTQPQVGATLNERLQQGMRTLLEEHDRAIIMSTDSPHLPLTWIGQGFALLDQHDIVLGPCTDGGYYLVGMRRPLDVFTRVPMSTPTVLQETLALAQRQGLSAGLLPETFDVDDNEGLAQLERQLAGMASDELPRTRAALAARRFGMAASAEGARA